MSLKIIDPMMTHHGFDKTMVKKVGWGSHLKIAKEITLCITATSI